MIHAPYNFVPINKEVYFPEWSHLISHDVPFSDGESGEITIKIKAISPIFIRNGSSKDKDEEFSHYVDENGNKKYFIPGTSIKGSIRNVLEIMSFSKLSIFNDDKYSIRDMKRPELYRDGMDLNNIRCGWLRITHENSFEITDCGSPEKIRHSEIDEMFNTDFQSSFTQSHNHNLRVDQKIAKFKYHLLNTAGHDVFNTITHNGITGTLVCTGQPSLVREELIGQENENPGKYHEFIFPESSEESITYSVCDTIRDTFLFAYMDGLNSESKDWAFWKKQLKDSVVDRIPVFFTVIDNELKHFGLSQLYKLPFNRFISDCIPEKHKKDEFDLSQCIFGTVENHAIKGRVHFPIAENTNNSQLIDRKTENLSKPKASYYPNYLIQTNITDDDRTNPYVTYMDDVPLIKGRKRYPVHPHGAQLETNQGTERTDTSFTPLEAGSEFQCKIRFHNLRRIELGALMAAITFAGHQDEYYHSLGMAKPLGFGKVKIDIKDVKSGNMTADNYFEYIEDFINEIETKTPVQNWKFHESIVELCTMSSEQQNRENPEAVLRYMELGAFADAKDQNEYMHYYSHIGQGIIPNPPATTADFLKFINENILQINELYKYYRSNKGFCEALESVLEEIDFNQELLNLYRRYNRNPKILYKYLIGHDVQGGELRDILNNITNIVNEGHVYDKSIPETQQIFHYIFQVRNNGQVPDQIPQAVRPFHYTWNDMNLSQDQILDIIDKIGTMDQVNYPPIKELRQYIQQTSSMSDDDRAVILEMYDSVMNEQNQV